LTQHGGECSPRELSKTPTVKLISREELNDFSGYRGRVMGRFNQTIAESQYSIYLDIGTLTAKEQEEAIKLPKFQRKKNKGESVLI